MLGTHRFIPALALAAAVAVAAPACASYGYGDRGYGGNGYPQRGVYPDVERRAYDSGYRDGINDGEKDARKHRSFAFDRHDDWRDADDGYHRDFGPKEYYRRSFRRGFEVGYREGFARFARGYDRR